MADSYQPDGIDAELFSAIGAELKNSYSRGNLDALAEVRLLIEQCIVDEIAELRTAGHCACREIAEVLADANDTTARFVRLQDDHVREVRIVSQDV
jgi:hypothetical protein